jgi:hypothetical protein
LALFLIFILSPFVFGFCLHDSFLVLIASWLNAPIIVDLPTGGARRGLQPLKKISGLCFDNWHRVLLLGSKGELGCVPAQALYDAANAALRFNSFDFLTGYQPAAENHHGFEPPWANRAAYALRVPAPPCG